MPIKEEVVAELSDIDRIISLAHFKGHADTGLGGAIKNIGAGLVTNLTKFKMHTTAQPFIRQEKCDCCDFCRPRCPVKAISQDYVIEPKLCISCGDCIALCPRTAITVEWNEPKEVVQEKMCEQAYAIAKNKPILYLDFLLNISPECDCHLWSNPSS